MTSISQRIGAAIAGAILDNVGPDDLLAKCGDAASCCTKADEDPIQFPYGQAGLGHDLEITLPMPCVDLAEAARLSDLIRERLDAKIADDAITVPGHLIMEAEITTQVVHLDRVRSIAFLRYRIAAKSISEQ
ncbi:MAG: hypothetical protein APF82_00980 [Sphingomonadales bacterium BRH_c42]|nr:MAG: hypothetical protein APF82_00980 [Sphingomonadales bacterium BRH_c42]